MSVRSITDTATSVVVAALLAVALLVVVVGLVKAWRGRRRTQLIISDIASTDDLPASAVAGLSALLRQDVRRQLSNPATPRESSLRETVGDDLRNRLVEMPWTAEGLQELERRIVVAAAEEVLSSQRDELRTASTGILALAPSRAGDLLGALSAALPAQRGLMVTVTPLVRQVGDAVQTGLTVDIAALGRAPQSSATFWADAVPGGHDAGSITRRTQMFDLLEPAATWIALQVIGRVAMSATRRRTRGRGQAGTPAQRRALCDILTAQWAGYTMTRLFDHPLVALGFADQALESSLHAARTMPRYHRPSYLLATIQEHRAQCYASLHELATDVAVAALSASRAQDARAAAVDGFRAAEAMLPVDAGDADVAAAARDRRERIKIRRLKVQLLAGDGRAALDELVQHTVRVTDTFSRYNAACLYATAGGLAHVPAGEKHLFRTRAWELLLLVLLADPRFARRILTDPDLAALPVRARRALATEIGRPRYEHVRPEETASCLDELRAVIRAHSAHEPPVVTGHGTA